MLRTGLLQALAVSLIAMSITACDGVIHKKISIDNGKGLSLGARQRTILVTQHGGKSGNQQVVCAEPSPDVFAVRAASAAASLRGPLGGTSPQGQQAAAGGFGFSSTEAAATIGRTQTIQLLRDGLYRLCEAYMNGAVDETQYNVALVNMDKVMTSLLAIDAIGGTPVPPLVGITAGKASAGASVPSTQPQQTGGQGQGADKSKTATTQVIAPQINVTAGEGQEIKFSSKDILRGMPGDKTSDESIKEIALAHRRTGDKVASFVAMCVGILARDNLDPRYPPHAQLAQRCNHFLKLASNRDFILAMARGEDFMSMK